MHLIMFGFFTMKKRRGQVGGLTTAAIGIVSLAAILGFGALIMDQINTQAVSQAGAESVADNVTKAGLAGLGTFGDWIPIVVITILAVAVIGLFLRSFSGFARV